MDLDLNSRIRSLTIPKSTFETREKIGAKGRVAQFATDTAAKAKFKQVKKTSFLEIMRERVSSIVILYLLGAGAFYR